MRMRNQVGQDILVVDDVCVGQQQVVWAKSLRGLDSLLHRPELARPALWQGLAGQNFEPVYRMDFGGGSAGLLGGAITAPVVDEIHDPVARIILAQDRADALSDAVGFVARRDHYGDPRPGGRSGRSPIVALCGEPKASTPEQKVKPGDDRDRSKCRKHEADSLSFCE